MCTVYTDLCLFLSAPRVISVKMAPPPQLPPHLKAVNQGGYTAIWNKISEFFQRFVEYMPPKIKSVLKAKGSLTWYKHSVPNKVALGVYFSENNVKQ